jgi:ABC-2 type transport system permease protein
MKNTYFNTWIKDWWDIFCNEFKQILADEGVMIIFVVAGLIYPILYNFVYYGGIINDTPMAVVDLASCKESRKFIREMDATREVKIAAKCMNMEEAKDLMAKRKVNGIIYFPADYGMKMARHEQAYVSVYCDMSAFLYCKNDLIGTNMVMIHDMRELQLDRFKEKGLTDEAANQQVLPMGYDDNKPYNPQANYSFFLITGIMLIMIQQIMYYGMSVLVGTNREENRSFASLPDKLEGHGRVRIVLGRGAAYWLLFMGIGIYIVVP